MSAAVHLIVGPVGAGKSTFGRRRCADGSAVFFDLDPWMVRLFGPDKRPKGDPLGWYLERRERCRGVIWETALDVVRAGKDVYLELGLLTVVERASYVQRARDADLSVMLHVADAPRHVRRTRVLARNESDAPFVQVVPPAFFEGSSDAWEPLTEGERRATPTHDV